VDYFGEFEDPENLTQNLTPDLHISRKNKFSIPHSRPEMAISV